MLIIEKIVQEFNDVYDEFEEAKRTNNFHEASDMKSYMYGLTKAMTMILDCNVNNYTLEDSQKVSISISKLNKIDGYSVVHLASDKLSDLL